MMTDKLNSGGFSHYSVMLGEAIEGLAIKPNGTYADGTAGGGGHSFEIATRLGDGGHLIAVDRDEDAIEAAKLKLRDYTDRTEFVHDNFCNIASWLGERKLDGLLLDLGVSSYQLDTPGRGFSYMRSDPLDMRMDRQQSFDAKRLVNNYSHAELIRVLRDWGEERFAVRIATAICETRENKEITTTGELTQIIRSAVPKSGDMHPEKRSFQAIRIEVNRELDVIEPVIRAAAAAMRPGGRIVIITFHSLEDRIVKTTFADLARGCICPPDFPVCVCNRKPIAKIITKKPILPSETECKENSRSRSAKLRILEKL